MTIRVLTVLDSLGGGGIETTLLRCLPGLLDAGVIVDVCVHEVGGELEDEYLAYGARVVRIPKTGNIARNAMDLARTASRLKADIIHTRMGYRAAGPVLASRLSGTKAIVSLHSTDPGLDRWKQSIGGRIVRAAWLKANRAIVDVLAPPIVGHSRATLDAYSPGWERATAGSYFLVLNGVVDHSSVVRLTKECARSMAGIPIMAEAVLLSIGGMRPGKNQEYLVRMMQLVLRQVPKAMLVIVGDGERRPIVEQAIVDAGLLNAVRLVGFQQDVQPYLQSADLFVSGSLHEGFGNALVEAQAAMLPAIASDIPGHREALAPVYHPDMLTLRDVSTDAQKIVARLRMSQGARSELAHSAFAYVSATYSINGMVDRLVKLYRKVLRVGEAG